MSFYPKCREPAINDFRQFHGNDHPELSMEIQRYDMVVETDDSKEPV